MAKTLKSAIIEDLGSQGDVNITLPGQNHGINRRKGIRLIRDMLRDLGISPRALHVCDDDEKDLLAYIHWVDCPVQVPEWIQDPANSPIKISTILKGLLKEGLSDFIRELKGKLPKGATVELAWG